MARSMNAVGACLASSDGSRTLIAQPVSPGLVDPIQDFVTSGWYQRDLRGARAWPAFREGRTMLVEHDISTESERRRSAYHNEWLRPWDLPWWGAMGVGKDDRQYGLVLLRNDVQGPLSHAEMEPLRLLRPHITRVLSLVELFALKQGEAALDAMEGMDRAAIMLDGTGRVLKFNPRTEPFLGVDLDVVHGRLKARHPANDRGLQKLIARMIAPFRDLAAKGQQDWTVIERPGEKAIVVSGLPIVAGLTDILGGARALIVVNDLGSSAGVDPQKLKALFGLTPAEVRLAMKLGAGMDLSEVSENLEISIGTARHHLKSIFQKTDVRRQGELIKLINRIGGL
ncbi:helix-turn-helix transcriptional regulator [Azorhizobium oxalatiphilum]|nr:helix-turn-helix transcriptional regulator [Azorhizobium oxalatiphilum]